MTPHASTDPPPASRRLLGHIHAPAALVIGTFWLYAGLWKLVDSNTLGTALTAHGVLPLRTTTPIAVLLPPLEAALGLCIALGGAAGRHRLLTASICTGLALLLCFMAYIAIVPAEAIKAAGCGCGVPGSGWLSRGLGMSERAGLLGADAALVGLHVLCYLGTGPSQLTPTPRPGPAPSP